MPARTLGSFTVSTDHLHTFQSFTLSILAVTGHGIPQETIDDLFAAMEAYFSFPLGTKMKVT